MAANKDNTFSITLDKFHVGYSPLAFNNSLTEFGGGGSASVMVNADIVNGDYLTQGPGLATLTAGTEAGAVSDLISFIMDKAVAADVTYAISATKLHQLSSTAVANATIWPHTITGCADGHSIQYLKGKLYYFYNTSSAGDIGTYDLTTTFNDDWGSTVPTGAAALQKANHPSAVKEDIMVFGNGRYAGVYLDGSTTITPNQLDFGQGASVDDVLYNSGYWYLAVNTGATGTNRSEGQIYLFDGAALINTLTDETGVGMQRIGFLYRVNGLIYVGYQDLSSTGWILGYINNKSITPLGRFSGTLPTYAQKTLYKNTIIALSSTSVVSGGSLIGDLPFQTSQLADGGYSTVGAIAAPFGTPMVASSQSTSFKLAKFSGYDVNSSWKSIVFPTSLGKYRAAIDEVVVLTKALGASARCDLTIEANQGVTSSTVKSISTTGKTRHYFNNFGLPSGGIEDFRVVLDWANGSATNDAAIRRIIVTGHFITGV